MLCLPTAQRTHAEPAAVRFFKPFTFIVIGRIKF